MRRGEGNDRAVAQGAVVDAAGPGQDRAIGDEGDQSATGQHGPQCVSVLVHRGVAPQIVGRVAASKETVGDYAGQILQEQVACLAAQNSSALGRQADCKSRFNRAVIMDLHGCVCQHLLAWGFDTDFAAPAAAPPRGKIRRMASEFSGKIAADANAAALIGIQPFGQPGNCGLYACTQAAGRGERVRLHRIDREGEAFELVGFANVSIGLVALAVDAVERLAEGPRRSRSGDIDANLYGRSRQHLALAAACVWQRQ